MTSWWDFARWAMPAGFIFSIILIPAINYWLARKYVTTAAMTAKTDGISNRIAELATIMQTVVGKQEQVMSRLVELETKMEVFWNMIEKSTANLLHRDDTPLIDRLLEKLPAENLTEPERKELLGYLDEIEVSTTRPRADRVAAIMLKASILARYHDSDEE